MPLAELLKIMDAAGVSLTQLERFQRTDIGTFYSASVKVWKGMSCTGATANGPTQEAALEAAMRSTGLFEEFPVIRIEAPSRRRRSAEDLLA